MSEQNTTDGERPASPPPGLHRRRAKNAADVIAALPEELRRAALTHTGSADPTELAPADIAALEIGTRAYALAFGAWRLGVAVKTTRARATILYNIPTGPDRLRLATTDRPRVGRHHPAARDRGAEASR